LAVLIADTTLVIVALAAIYIGYFADELNLGPPPWRVSLGAALRLNDR
jgi:hypothetical protein